MALLDFTLPLAGESHGMPVTNQEEGTSAYMLNCRPRDVLEGRLRIGQRPGLKKAYAQQIGGDTAAIVWIGSVTTVD